MIELTTAKKLLALAMDAGASTEERRTAAVKVCEFLQATNHFGNVVTCVRVYIEMKVFFRKNRGALNCYVPLTWVASADEERAFHASGGIMG